jgi:hypothetical protein
MKYENGGKSQPIVELGTYGLAKAQNLFDGWRKIYHCRLLCLNFNVQSVSLRYYLLNENEHMKLI